MRTITPVPGSFVDLLLPADREALLGRGVVRSFGRGDVLHRQGDPATHVLVVIEGWCRVAAVDRRGAVILLALRGAGDVLGELAAVNGWPRTATVAAIEPVDVIQLTGPEFVATVRSRPDVAMALLRNMSERLRSAQEARMDLATLDVGRRLAAHLLHLAAQHGRRGPAGLTIELPLTQQDLADALGASRRAISRALGVLRERGAVTTSARRIVVHRPTVLRALAGSPDDVR